MFETTAAVELAEPDTQALSEQLRATPATHVDNAALAGVEPLQQPPHEHRITLPHATHRDGGVLHLSP